MESDVEKTIKVDMEDEVNNHAKSPGWASLFNFTLRSHFFALSVALVISVASGVIIPALAIILGKIFNIFTDYGSDEINGPDLVNKVSTYCYALVGLGAGSGILNAGYFMSWLVFGELQAKSVRDRLFDGMLEKDMEWYDMRKAGIDTLIPRLQKHVRELQMANSQPLGFAIQYTVTTLAALGVAFYTAWNLTLVTLAVLPFAAIVLAWTSAIMQPSIDIQAAQLTQASKLVNNAISAIETVKCFNGQDFEIWQYASTIRKAARYYLVQAQANALQIGFVRLVTLGMFVQGFWYGSRLVAEGTKDAGQVLTTFWACLMATQAIEQILPQMIVLETGRAAGATLLSVLNRVESGRKFQRKSGLTPRYCDGDIEIQNVSFTYPSRPNQPALRNANFFFPAGETTFVVGRSGSGKSTLGNLLLRFYEPDSGHLLIDGNSLQRLDINWLRNNVTLVQQQSVLFNETIFKNIAFGRQDHFRVRKGDVKRSIETALLQHTIKDLPQGLDTVVGVNGSAMSGGQKQRVAIARARLRDTPILILDEATSALDHISKTLVLEQIHEWRQGKTTIIITHDMSQIKEKEYVYVLDDGFLSQEGFKHTLEKSHSGPFEKSLRLTINHPSMAFRRKHDKSDNATSDSHPTPMANEFLGFDFFPKSQFVPVMGDPPEEVQSRRESHSLISPIFTAALQMNHMSTVPEFPQAPWNRSQPINLLGDLPSEPTSPIDDIVHEADKRTNTLHPIPVSLHGFRRLSTVFSSPAKNETPPVEKGRKGKNLGRVAPIRTILKTVWPTLTRTKRFILVCGFLAAAVHAAATPTFSYVFSKLLTTFFLKENRSKTALKWSLSVLAVAIIDSIASFAMHYLLEYCGQAWIDNLRIEALKRILDQPCAWFDRDQTKLNQLTEALDRNAEEMRNLIGRFAGFVFVAVLMMVMAVTWSLVLCWKLTLVGLASAPVLYGITRAFEAISGRWESNSNDAGQSASSIFIDTFTNIKLVRALTLEGYFHKKYARTTYRAFAVGMKRAAFSGLFFGLSDCGIIFVTALIFYYGAVLASSDTYSTQDILTVFTMLLFSIANVNAIISFIPQMSSSRDTATRLLRLCNLPYRTSHEHTGHIRLPSLGPITLSSLSFTYPSRPTHPILSSLSLTLPPGSTTAITGSSGCGKSTLASLLLGLYPPTRDGTISISNLPFSSLHLPTLRSLIVLVPQSPHHLLPTTVAQNIAYALPRSSPLASFANIRSAATLAGIHTFISQLPAGYDTLLGAGGTQLSGGQAQRLALARALARRPRLLILDEPASGLDAESARGVRDLVRGLGGRGKENGDVGVGVLVITHEREMMMATDRVVVLGEGGRVVEEGRFGELWRRGEELRRLVG